MPISLRFSRQQALAPAALGISCIIKLLSVDVVPAQAEPNPGIPWQLVQIPDAWRNMPAGELAPINGYSWYRCAVEVPESWKGAPLTLFVEALDDARASYFNGVNVGATGTFPPQYRSGLGETGRYAIDAGLVLGGELNTIAIRVFQDDPRPNFSVAPPVLLNENAMQAIRMEGQWQYRPGDDAHWSKATPGDNTVKETGPNGGDDASVGFFAKVDHVADIERYVARRKGDNDPFSPADAERSFEVPEDLEFQLVLSEPEIAQPLFMSWDERGRLWVMEYRQYPDPAGLKMVSRDIYLRTVYDKVPPAPPHHFPGRDRISIHEDTDGDGAYDEHKIFVDGLNIATSFAHGRGGLWVTNPPYLLFYPDRNRDDIPDGDPEVHLEGFGLEDTHSVINSIRFGPDGWLYAAQGSTVTATVRRPGSNEEPLRTMGQQIWRYHPELRRFEVFAEGGGNTFGVEIDAKGRIYSGHNGGDTRGFHYVQGSYSRKGFGKHGSLSNPYAFGYFEQMRHHSVPRFTHNFVIYEADELPEKYYGQLFGIEPLQGQVVMSSFEPYQSTFETTDISRPVTTNDQWFRPVDIKAGPDGCIYVADMYEQRIDHSSHYAGRVDRTSGRIYRIKPADATRLKDFDYGQFTSEELISLLNRPNKWHRQTALRLLGDRKDESLIPLLIRQTANSKAQLALESLWALHLCGGLTDKVASGLLDHDDPFVRAWTVRLLCNRRPAAPPIAQRLAKLAATEARIEVRKQLASSAQRLPPRDALPIIRNLLTHDEDAEDIHQPLLLWWALERQAADEGRDLILDMLRSDSEIWHRPLMTEHLIERLMKRYALAGSRQELLAAAALLEAAPDKRSSELLLKGFEEAYQGRSLAGIPEELVHAIAKSGGGSTALRLRQGNPQAIEIAVETVADVKANAADRLQFVQIFGELRHPKFISILLDVLRNDTDEPIISASLTSLQAFNDPRIGEKVIEYLPDFSAEARLVAETLLASRSAWAVQLLKSVDDGTLAPDFVSDTALRKMLLHDDPRVQELVSKHWGAVAGATTEEMRTDVEQFLLTIKTGSGNPKSGKPLFAQHCGKCHRLFDEGGDVGPDLTAYQRDDIQRVLVHVVNPSAEIREGFENYVLVTTEGRVVNGFLADEDSQVVVLRGVDGQNLIFRRDEIDELQAIPRSVMPEETLRGLSEQQIRDLFAYLLSSQPVNY